MQDTVWLQQELFYFSKRIAWRWRWTFAAIFAVISLYFYDAEAGIIIWSALAVAVFLIILGLLVFFNTAKLIAVDNSGVSFFDSRFEENKILINWSVIESINTQKTSPKLDNTKNVISPNKEPLSLYFQLNTNPFPKDFYPSHFLWDSKNLLLELNTLPKQGFPPLLKIINQFHPRLLKLNGFSIETQPTTSLFSLLFGLFYDLVLIIGTIGISLIIAFYHVFETDDALERIKKLDGTELQRLYTEFERRFLSEKMDFSVKTSPTPTYFLTKQLLFDRHFQNPPHTKQAWHAGLFTLNAIFSWTDEVAYIGSYSLKIKMTKKKVGEPDMTVAAWNSTLPFQPGEGYLLEAYVLSSDNARSSLTIEAFDVHGDLITAFNSDCQELEFNNQWFYTQHKVDPEKIPPMTRNIRFAVQQCVGEDDAHVGTLYYDAIRVYALQKNKKD